MADIMLQKGFREQVSSIIQYLKEDCQFAIYLQLCQQKLFN